MFPRVREIADPFGGVVRISIEPRPGGALVVIDRPDAETPANVTLDTYGADILLGYIMSARLAVPDEMPEEEIGGAFPTRFQLEPHPEAAIIVDQLNDEEPLRIPVTLWDRIYADLCIVCAHARELARKRQSSLH
ncbi:hypothetical protein GRI68_09605 [Altererythrobacter halimionae]|uniref:Uncharacterized protein n=1 Tax=Alteriqipengyuania halimionae TaxID=1926630 RepID=A0A6I4U7R9_9SPHN|nr:hypothetical protein [Alteriqipengyuania halimionae]